MDRGDPLQAQLEQRLAAGLDAGSLATVLSQGASIRREGIWKFLIQTLVTPLSAGVFGVFVSGKVDKAQQGFVEHLQSQEVRAQQQAQQRHGEELKRKQAEEQQRVLVGKRLWIWDQLAPGLHDIQCYMDDPAMCGALTANDVLARKQHCDFIISAYRDYLPPTMLTAYGAYVDAVFAVEPQGDLRVRLRTSLRKTSSKTKADRPKPALFAYGKDAEAAQAQRKVILDRWAALRAAISQMLAPESTGEAQPAPGPRP